MDPLQQILVSFGINLASSAVYDFVKDKFTQTNSIDVESLKLELASFLKTEITNSVVDKIINYLIDSGSIDLKNKTVIAGNIILNASNAKEATGVHITTPTEFKPGSSISVTADNVDKVTGVKIENIIK